MPPSLLPAVIVAGFLLWPAVSIAVALCLGRMIHRADLEEGRTHRDRMPGVLSKGCASRARFTHSGVAGQGSSPKWVTLR
ncbi:hypothetical protein [Subtercola boreus]|uniref:hypothetical protein n=1 Tax=Subtercola boreus TaxID=120213 RepID=UPI000E2EA13A|nr:hypothetical protein [Subtercola boreus]TQL54786.1 hypothetical protein FB464_2330 [Subtercola boreus]